MTKLNGGRFFKFLFLVVVAVFFIINAADRQGYHFFDNVDLVIHEAGHVFFAFFGEFVAVAGGTIMQLLVPLVFAGYFFLRNDRYAAGIVLMWLGQSFVNVARYAADAARMELPLLGGGTHDWNYMLIRTNLLDKAQAVSEVIYYGGVMFIIVGIILGTLSFAKGNIKPSGSIDLTNV